MKRPGCLEFTEEEIEDLMQRLEEHTLREQDYPLLIDLIKAIIWMNLSLQEKSLSIKRLRAVFGIKTETANRLFDIAGQGPPPPKEGNSDGDEKEDKKGGKGGKGKEDGKKPKGGNGHRPSSDYTEAKTIKIAHQTLKRGDICPECKKGKLFNLSPGSVIRIVGAPYLQVEVYRPERLRCSLCQKIFTAVLPKEVMKGSRSDQTAKAIVSLMKYRGGVPFYRQEQMQKILGTPISASEIWKMTGELANELLSIYAHICTEAAKGKLIQNDDTKARILSIMKERKDKQGTDQEEKRKGTFTTGILSTLQDSNVSIALFFTGRQHAGENLNDLLDSRPENYSPPIQQCDGGHNAPKDHDTHRACCLAHARRKFYELVDYYPAIVLQVIGWFTQIFSNEHEGPEDPDELLKWHQKKSGPIMEKIRSYCNDLIASKQIEPNSSMGKAIAYFNNHFEQLTLFLRLPGVPLTNNDTERLLKRAVLNRKNAYFYKNETGAKIGDILMSVIETCVLNEVNPWKYLIAIQENQQKVQKSPELWIPWKYKEQLEKSHPP